MAWSVTNKTMQALGWRMALEGKPRYLALQDDIASTAFWYQLEPHATFPTLPSFEYLEVSSERWSPDGWLCLSQSTQR